jgi:hypothetical protein
VTARSDFHKAPDICWCFLVLLPVASSIKMPFSHPTGISKKPGSTGWTPVPTPAPVVRNQLFRRDGRTCGALQGGYTDAPPVCSGSASVCIFTSSSGYQGCCQDANLDYCTFYTTCYPYSNQASCTGSCTSSGLVWYVHPLVLTTAI